MNYDVKIASMIDLAVLKQTLTVADVEAAAGQVADYGLASICVPTTFCASVRDWCIRQNFKILICSVIGFPFGYSDPYAKYEEIESAMKSGAHEFDYVINYAAFKNIAHWQDHSLELEARKLEDAIQFHSRFKLKAILETCFLTPDEIRAAVKAIAPHVDFIKTSTGFGTRGASLEDIHIIKDQLVAMGLDQKVGIKASGGIKTYQQALDMVAAGATRLGVGYGPNLTQIINLNGTGTSPAVSQDKY